MGYRFLILGEPMVEGPEGRIDIRSRKGQALLWYCATQSEREFTRLALAELFWGDGRTGLDSLGMALARLRRELPVWPLRVTRQAVGWDPGSDIFLDARRFNELLAAEAETAEGLEEAERLWRGSFLEGFDPAGNEDLEGWLVEQRAYWDQRIIEVLSRLTRWREERSDWEGVIATAQRAIRLDPLREAFHRSLIQAHYRTGDRAAALRRYADCREILLEELGVEPDETTQALAGVITQSPPMMADFDSFRTSGPVLAGREEVLALLGAALSQAETGAPRVVLLSGKSGAGRRRLVDEISRWASPEGRPKWTVLRGYCREEDRSTPLASLSEALRASLPRFPRAWRDFPEVWQGEIRRLLPEVAEDLDQPPLPVDDREEGKRRLIEAVELWLLALPRPSLLILEDIQWADPASLALLGRLARRTSLGPIILLTVETGRSPEPVRRLLDQLEREGRLVRQEVDPPTSKGIGRPQWRLIWKSSEDERDPR